MPAVVVGEVLCNVPIDHHAAMFQVLNEAFVIAPYDMRAAVHNARIWQEQNALRQELRSLEIARQAIKADIMIVSSALAYGCETLYTEDKGWVQLAQQYIRVVKISEVPLPPRQPDLFS